MAPERPPDPVLARAEEVLTAWFLAEERGETPALESLCGGDGELARRVRELLAREPAALRRLGAGEAREPATADPAVPAHLGDFRLVRRLGVGGMASVFLAWQESLGRRVALKVLDRALVQDERARRRFQREAELVAALDHPHIVPVYAVGEADGFAYLAMKLLDGPSLAELALPLAPREVARIGRAVADALEAAHLAGVIHRDVKPANILFDHGEPCLVDFGLARAQTDVTLTRAGAVPGTLPYLAPELLGTRAPRLDPRLDVYALGATLYELLAARPPHALDEPERMLRRILTAEIAPLRLPARERDLETIVLCALERDPRRRIESARALADDLARYLDDQPIAARRTPWPARLRARARRNPALAATGALALALAATAAGSFAWNALESRRELARGLAAARGALAARDFAGALARIRPLAEAHGAGPELAALRSAAAAGAAEDELVTAVLNRPAAIDPAELEARMRAAEATRADAPAPGIVGAALVLGAFHLGRTDEARRRLAELGPAPLAPALEALLDGREPPATPAERAAALTADERVLSALVLRLAGQPLARQEADLELALRAEPAHAHARYAHAVALAGAGLQQRAREVLWGLVRGADTPREVWRNLAHSLIATDDLEAAREVLERIPRSNWTPVEGYLELELLARRGDWSAFEAELSDFHGRCERGAWTPSGEILRAEAEYLGQVRGQVAEADALFERVLREAGDVVNRDLAAASQYTLAVDRAARALGPGLAERRPACQPLLERGRVLVDELAFPRARGLVLWKLGLVHLYLAENGAGFARLEEAIALLPDHAGPRLDYVQQVGGFLAYLAAAPAPPHAPAGFERSLALRAWQEAGVLRERLANGDLVLPSGTRRALLAASVDLQERLCDWTGLAATVPELRALADTPELVERCERLARAADEGLRFVYGR